MSFSATGRLDPSTNPESKAMDSLASGESFGMGPANHSPFRFTDDSIISVPVMRPEDVSRQAVSNTPPPSDTTDHGREKAQGKKFSLFPRRHSKDKSGENFTMRQIPRREYLARYAKDEEGRYIGTQDPAEDCILHGEDLVRFRGKRQADFRTEIHETEGAGGETPDADDGGKKNKRGLLRGLRGADAGDEVIR
ncbi:hypothetical protein PV05_08177 [Exophiala xenobiotica]|uniref:Uncharacterized protein n=1 Tax=Exophiala xenobiotica TaxID=348802 RepID=A0A0D2CRF7_9EURO|nr:uncharacterized protein PV05_08177 [Exophiala xenobiotica]KIW52547.1 hypothetical protein PV05_08177 [Exophiala xenobiotica]